MKKTAFIFITLFSLIISLGSFGVFKLFIKQHHASVKKRIEKKEYGIIDTIYINPCQLFSNSKTVQWEDDNKEIIYNGELYDIVSMKNENGKVILYVISDKKEMEFKYDFAQQEDSNSNKNSPIKLLEQFLTLEFVNTPDFFFAFKNNTLNPTSFLNQMPFFIIHKGYQTQPTHPPICFKA